jgi:hypothetical protein
MKLIHIVLSVEAVFFIQTLAGYIVDLSKPEEYKDLNKSTCNDCGDVHTVHDRISLEEKEKLNENKS